MDLFLIFGSTSYTETCCLVLYICIKQLNVLYICIKQLNVLYICIKQLNVLCSRPLSTMRVPS
jgi:hypothetical protein